MQTTQKKQNAKLREFVHLPQGASNILQPETFDSLFGDESASALKDKLFKIYAMACSNPDYNHYFNDDETSANAMTLVDLFDFLNKMEELYALLANHVHNEEQ